MLLEFHYVGMLVKLLFEELMGENVRGKIIGSTLSLAARTCNTLPAFPQAQVTGP